MFRGVRYRNKCLILCYDDGTSIYLGHHTFVRSMLPFLQISSHNVNKTTSLIICHLCLVLHILEHQTRDPSSSLSEKYIAFLYALIILHLMTTVHVKNGENTFDFYKSLE